MKKIVNKNCKCCNKRFQALCSEIKRGRGEYCSRKCVHDMMNKKDEVKIELRKAKEKIKELEKEVNRKDKALAEVTALLILKKKLIMLIVKKDFKHQVVQKMNQPN